MSDKLKPCPFCGGEAAYSETNPSHIGDDNGFMVYCKKCYTESSYDFQTRENAIAAWNRRYEQEKQSDA